MLCLAPFFLFSFPPISLTNSVLYKIEVTTWFLCYKFFLPPIDEQKCSENTTMKSNPWQSHHSSNFKNADKWGWWDYKNLSSESCAKHRKHSLNFPWTLTKSFGFQFSVEIAEFGLKVSPVRWRGSCTGSLQTCSEKHTGWCSHYIFIKEQKCKRLEQTGTFLLTFSYFLPQIFATFHHFLSDIYNKHNKTKDESWE